MVEITEGEKAGTYLKGSKIMISTGCKPRTLPEIAVDGKRVMTSREALAMTEQPKSIAIMGAGAIGAEFAYFLKCLRYKSDS
jgi:dihydrolipoamide dehydrogenase